MKYKNATEVLPEELGEADPSLPSIIYPNPASAESF